MAKDPKLDCYAILGVHPNAEDVVIRAAFKALAQRYHPDRFSGSKDEAHRRMSDLASAYEVLADPVRRRRYDRRRRLYARTASFYIKDTSRDKHPPFAIVKHVPVAVRQRRYRVALSALMAAVVVLTAFNIYQYSGRLKEWVGSSPAAPPVAADAKRGSAPEVPIPATAGAAPSDPPPDTSAAKVPARPPAADANRGVTASVAVPQSAPTLRKEAKPTPAKPAVARNAPAKRSGTASPAAAASEPCSDVVAALGLCKPNAAIKEN
jgi:hypothetical protein